MPNKQKTVTSSNTVSSTQTPQKHHRVRTFFAGVFGFIGLGLIILSIFVLWISNTVTNTDSYVNTVSQVANDESVKIYVVERVSGSLLDNKDVPMDGLSEVVLSVEQRTGKTDAELRSLIEPLIKEDVQKIVESPTFENLWSTANREMHATIVGALDGSNKDVSYDFRPLIDGVIAELRQTRFATVADKIEMPDDKGIIVIKSSQLDPARKIYNYFKIARIAIVVIALLCIVISVLLSIHHIRTIRRILVFNGLFFALVATALSATKLLDKIDAEQIEKDAIISIADIVIHDLRIASIVIAVVCLAVAIGSKLQEKLSTRNK